MVSETNPHYLAPYPEIFYVKFLQEDIFGSMAPHNLYKSIT